MTFAPSPVLELPVPTPLDRQCAALAGLPPYVFAQLDRLKQDARARGTPLVDLGIGSPDKPMDPSIVAELQRAAGDPSTHGYPTFRGLPRYQESIARFMDARFGVAVDARRETLALAGSKEGIAQLLAACAGAGDVVLVPEIYYPVYARAAQLAGAEVFWVPMRAGTGFLADLEAVPAEVARRARLLVVNYPNNPTGAAVDVGYFERAVSFAREHGLALASDLAYSELTYDGYVAPSVLQVPGALDVAVEFHSCSKSFSMAGVRAGFAVGNAALIDAIAAYRTNVGYGVPTLVQHAAAFALDDFRRLSAPTVATYRARRDALVAALREAGWSVAAPKAAMYVWLPAPAGVGDWEFAGALLDEAGVVVTPGSAFGPGGAGYFRVSLVADADVLRLAARRMGELVTARGWTI
jgi:LL-diaminopimelate aminotransferase